MAMAYSEVPDPLGPWIVLIPKFSLLIPQKPEACALGLNGQTAVTAARPPGPRCRRCPVRRRSQRHVRLDLDVADVPRHARHVAALDEDISVCVDVLRVVVVLRLAE